MRPGVRDLGGGGAPDPLQYELLQETAASLGRAGRRLQGALQALRVAADEEERGALLDEAADALWRYVVQREACGLRGTEALMESLGVPAAVRLRMGCRRGPDPDAGRR